MRFWQSLLSHTGALQHLVTSELTSDIRSKVSLSREWHVLGPFPIGTREASWGADPLEELGGFRALREDDKRHFDSPLAARASINWTTVVADIHHSPSSDTLTADVRVSFSGIDWPFLQHVYGWSALQWQGWARGYIMSVSKQTELFTLHLDAVLELWVDDEHYFGGDFYGIHKSPILLSLAPGKHKIDLRLIRDVRSMGGITEDPAVKVRLELSRTTAGLHKTGTVVVAERLDDQNGAFASTYASVILRNDGHSDIFITGLDTKHSLCIARLHLNESIRLISGQSRPIAFQVDCVSGTSAYSIDLWFRYNVGNDTATEQAYYVRVLESAPVSRYNPHIITYLHPAGIVSRGLLRPPARNCDSDTALPVFLVLHGAGVDITEAMSRHSLDEVADTCAWTLLPSGSTIWSGDDWHVWGWADVEAAIASIPQWIEQVDWRGPGVDLSKWLVAGHSNGGQGTWYALTHFPDRLLAAAPISAYSSIQNYVPFNFWQLTDPGRKAVLEAQLLNYRHEVLLENALSIPVLTQHGGADDNVPTYHSRLMYSLTRSIGMNSTYHEAQDASHWWDGVMTTPPLKHFYNRHLTEFTPMKPTKFSLTAATAGTGLKRQGFQIESLTSPGRLGKLIIDLTDRPSHCLVTTSNIKMFSIEIDVVQQCSKLVIDAQTTDTRILPTMMQSYSFRQDDKIWKQSSLSACYRSPRQSGGLEALLRSNGTVQIVQHETGSERAVTQIANNLHQYFGADVAVATSYEEAKDRSGHIISITTGMVPGIHIPDCPNQCRFDIQSTGLKILRGNLLQREVSFDNDEIAALYYLRSLPSDRLELILWHRDLRSLSLVMRMLPLMTGSGFPDFVIATEHMLSRGLSGTFALGHLDSDWCPASTSYWT